ncbi:hypothetical protein VTK73DRAFT_4572 [Phialemonium thermophilum]|uniref:Uncharacterized protein n=1 Tax=Phialemonium thermophilum TaxID=223376 RepID=A0ABR3V9F8_9PEZI
MADPSPWAPRLQLLPPAALPRVRPVRAVAVLVRPDPQPGEPALHRHPRLPVPVLPPPVHVHQRQGRHQQAARPAGEEDRHPRVSECVSSPRLFPSSLLFSPLADDGRKEKEKETGKKRAWGRGAMLTTTARSDRRGMAARHHGGGVRRAHQQRALLHRRHRALRPPAHQQGGPRLPAGRPRHRHPPGPEPVADAGGRRDRRHLQRHQALHLRGRPRRRHRAPPLPGLQARRGRLLRPHQDLPHHARRRHPPPRLRGQPLDRQDPHQGLRRRPRARLRAPARARRPALHPALARGPRRRDRPPHGRRRPLVARRLRREQARARKVPRVLVQPGAGQAQVQARGALCAELPGDVRPLTRAAIECAASWLGCILQ